MGILDKLVTNNERSKNSTKGFYFGAVEAEGEIVKGSSLTDYFKDYLGVLNELKNGKFLFIGRKGVGKSSIAKYIKDSSDNEESSYATLLRINDFELEKTIQLPESESNNKEKIIFEWLILVNLVKLIVNHNCGTYTQEYDKLKKFLDINAGIVNVDQYQVVEGNRNKGGEVSFGGLKHIFGGVFKNYFESNVNKAPFYKIIPPLRDILKIMLDYDVNKNLEFWLLFDDLDNNFSVYKESDKDKIMELIRVSKIYNNEIFRNNKAKILIFLRDDIRDSIVTKYNDSAKGFFTYEIPINWYNHKSYTDNSENLIPLKQLANKRIEINFDKFGISYEKDAWETLFLNENYNNSSYPFKSSFKYILDFTFYRPRDIITFLQMMTTEDYKFPLDKKSVKNLLSKYIRVNNNEIKSELKLFFTDSEVEKIFQSIFPFIVEKQNLKQIELETKINSLNFTLNSKEIIEILLNYSLIIFTDPSDGSLFFNYRDNSNLDNLEKSELTITLPKCIYHNYKKIN
jgi:hypothetical protein